MKPMARYCGQELTIVKCVRRFYDESKKRMVRCRNIVLLEGVYCDGSAGAKAFGCDRMCFVFWRTEWLERVKPTDG
jgi:hypothetical protein